MVEVESQLLENIADYEREGKALDFKDIIQTMNDTYNVGNCCSVKNGFNALRNVAVHETVEFSKAYTDMGNSRQSVFVIGSKTFRWSNIVFCLLCAYKAHPELNSLLEFAKAIMKWRLDIPPNNYMQVELNDNLVYNVFMLEEVGVIPKYYNTSDPYMKELIDKDVKSFLLRTIPCPEPVLAYALAYPTFNNIQAICSLLETRGCI